MDYRKLKKRKNSAIRYTAIALTAVVVIVSAIYIIGIAINSHKTRNTETAVAVYTEEPIQTEAVQETERTAKSIYKELIVDTRPHAYTYNDMEQDMKALCETYPEFVSLTSIGQTMDGRNVYDMVIGDINTSEHLMIQGSIHAREYMTTQLVMMQACDFIRALADGNGEYKGISYNNLFSNKAIHVIPMVNPDGVSISQLGMDGVNNSATKDRLLEIAAKDGESLDNAYYLRQWKANANGVDLNRNFDALWDQYTGPSHPSSDRYKGTNPGSENESAALIALTEQYNFVRTISYHTYGQVIYWYFGQTGVLRDETLSLAQEVAEVTGYDTDSNYEALDPAGYKDWAISKMSIPSLTIEVGYGENPLPYEQLDSVYSRNKSVWAAVLYNCMNN